MCKLNLPNPLGPPWSWDFSGVKLDMFAYRDVVQPTEYKQTQREEEQRDEERDKD